MNTKGDQNLLKNDHLISERLKRVIEASNTGIWEWNIKTNEVYYSPRWKQLLGYKDEEIPNEFATWQNNLHPDDLERMLINVTEYVQNPIGHFEHRFRMKHKKGHYVWILNRSYISTDKDGKAEFMSGSHLDITSSVEQEQILIESERRFRTLFKSLNYPLCNVDSEGKFKLINDEFINTFGYTLKDVPTLEEWWIKAYPDADYRNWVLKTWNEAVDTAEIHNRNIRSEEYVVTCKNGSKRNIIIGGFTLDDGFLATFVDVTDRVRAEQETQYAKEYAETIIQTANAILVVLDNEGKVRSINKTGENIIGRSIDELKGKNWFETIVPREKYPEVWLEFERLSKGGLPKTFENPILTKGGQERIISWQNAQFKADNQVQGIVSFGADITDQRIAAEKLKHLNEQLASSNKELEQFAYIASHDLQEPLRKVKNYIELFEDRYKENLDERANKYLDIVTNGVTRMQTLIDDLLQLSRVSTRGNILEQIDLREVIDNAIDILELKINERDAQLHISELPNIMGDKPQLIQLFQNLLSNSIKYCDQKPIIYIRAISVQKYWNIEVEDNGIGFDNKFKEKIFTAFQRLHSRDEYTGTGIGLAVCKKIAERHGGKISAISQMGKGSLFSIRFPKMQDTR